MKLKIVFLAISFLGVNSFAQNKSVPLSEADSIVYKHVDSLIQESSNLSGKREFEKALEVNAIAEHLTLEKFDTLSALFASVCFNSGRVYYVKGDLQEAENWYLKAKSIREKVLGKEHPDYAWSLNNLAILYLNMGNYKKAESFFLESMAIREKVYGKEHPIYSSSLNNLGSLYWKMGKYEKAEPIYLESKAIREKVLGKKHPDYAIGLNNLGNLYWKMGKYEKAEFFYMESKAIWEKVLGKGHPEYASSLNNLGILYRDMGSYEKAEPLQLEAMAIRKKVLGIEHPEYAQSLHNLVILYSEMGNYEKAEPLGLEAIAIREKLLGKEHPDYANSLNSLANLYRYMGNYEKAESLVLEAKTITEKVHGKEHPNYAASLDNLAGLYFDLLNYNKAESLYLESMAIREKVFGKEHREYAASLHNLANLYSKLGIYEKAELLLLESKAILERVLGKEHPDYALSLNSLANLYSNLGLYEKVEPLHLECKAIREKVFGKEHPDYAWSLNNLANLYKNMGIYEKAEPLHLECKAIREKVLGKEHPDYAASLLNFANLYLKLGIYEKAEPLLLESKAILERVLGKEHPDYANTLNSLANLYMDLGIYEKAEPFHLETKAIREKVLGKEHPYYAQSLYNLSILYTNMGNYEKAKPLFKEAINLNQKFISLAKHHLSEKEMQQYLLTFEKYLASIFSFAQQLKKTSDMAQLCYDNTLFFKGFLLNSYSYQKQLNIADTAFVDKYNLLKSYGRRLAAEYTKPIADRKGVAELEEKSNGIEKELAQNVSGYGESMKQVNWKEVQQKLNADEATIEFIHYRFFNKNSTDSIMYAALLLKPDEKQPQFIPLFEEKSLDSLLKSSTERKSDYVNNLYTHADRGAIALEAPKKSLYDLIWAPIEKHLQGVKKIYFSPSGLLHRINLDAIPISETETIGDHFQLITLNSSRQLVVPGLSNVNNQEVVLYGGVNYEPDSTFIDLTPTFASRSRGELSFKYVDSSLRGGNWNYLPGTEKEIQALEILLKSKSFKVTTKRGSAATEESFKNMGQQSNSPRVLHISTHGYFFPDPKKEVSSSQYLLGDQEPIFKISDHPMLRSGLILAGGNAGWQGKQTLEGKEDGVLTAYEISQMNLSNTELVVLSACETGLGDIQGNEGVYGLQRAFKIAGAKYLIMSLWQIPDRETKEFMVSFYKNWLQAKGPDKGGKKKSIPEAFRITQKEMRERFINPFSWAGFVLVE